VKEETLEKFSRLVAEEEEEEGEDMSKNNSVYHVKREDSKG